jgi:hypothetical protein
MILLCEIWRTPPKLFLLHKKSQFDVAQAVHQDGGAAECH